MPSVLCEMEQGTVNWEDTDRIDCIRRAHSQKHVGGSKDNWGKNDNKKPRFCKSFQMNLCTYAKDHETNAPSHMRLLLDNGKATEPCRKKLPQPASNKTRANSCQLLELSSCKLS